MAENLINIPGEETTSQSQPINTNEVTLNSLFDGDNSINFTSVFDDFEFATSNFAVPGSDLDILQNVYTDAMAPYNNSINQFDLTGPVNATSSDPGVAGLTYNPAEQVEGLNNNSFTQFQKELNAISNNISNNPNDKLKSNLTVSFGEKVSNFDRYYKHPNFDELGFNPYINNEDYYNTNASAFDEFQRMGTQYMKLFGNAFTSGYRALGDLFSGKEYFAGDPELGYAFEDAMRIGSSQKGGIGGFTNNFLLNSAYTMGIISNIAMEEVILAGVTALSGTTAAPLAIARTGYNIKRLADIPKRIRDGYTITRGIKTSANFLRDLKNVERARDVFNAGGRFVASTIAPETFALIKNWKSGLGVAKNVGNLAKNNKVFGAFYRDLRALNLAVAEGKLEGGLVQNQVYNDLYNQYVSNTGMIPDSQSLQNINTQAYKAGFTTTMINTPIIALSNRLVIGTALKGFPKSLGRSIDRYTKGVGSQVLRNKNVTKNAFSANKGLAPKRFYNLGAKGGAKAFGAGLLNYTSANIAEGLQEVFQEATAVGVEQYYKNIFNDPSLAGREEIAAAVREGVNSQLSGQGVETFLSGFFMAGPVQVAQKGLFQGLPNLYKKYTDPKAYQEYKDKKEKYVDLLVESANKVNNDPFKYFGSEAFNLTEQKRFNTDLNIAGLNGDPLAFYDTKDASLFRDINRVVGSGKLFELKDQIEDNLKLEDSELVEAYRDVAGISNPVKIRTELSDIIKRMDQIEASHTYVNDKFINPYDATKFTPGTREYNKEAINEIAFNEAKNLAIFTKDSFERALERINSIYTRLSQDPIVSKMSAKDLDVLLNKKELIQEIELLQDEIDTLDDTSAEGKRIKEDKQNRLKFLNNYFNVLNDPSNQTKEGRFNRSKINKLQKPVKEYLQHIADTQDDILNIAKQDFNDLLKDIVDHKTLNGRQEDYIKAFDILMNPENMILASDRLATVFAKIFNQRKETTERALKKYINLTEKNELINALANIGLYIEEEQLIEFFENDIEPTLFFTKDGPLNSFTDKKLFDQKEDLFKNYRRLLSIESDEDRHIVIQQADGRFAVVSPEGIVIAIAPTELEAQEAAINFDKAIEAAEEKTDELNVDVDNITESPQDIDFNEAAVENSERFEEANTEALRKKYAKLVKQKTKEGAPIPKAQDWQNSTEAVRIKKANFELLQLYQNEVAEEDQPNVGLRAWVAANERNPGVDDILSKYNLKINDVSGKKATPKQKRVGATSEVLNPNDKSGVFVVKNAVTNQITQTVENIYTIEDVDGNNLSLTYKKEAPSRLEEVYSTEGAANKAKDYIVKKLLPDETPFPFDGVDLNYGAVIESVDNGQQYVVMSKPKTVDKYNNIYVREIEQPDGDNLIIEEVGFTDKYKRIDDFEIDPTAPISKLLPTDTVKIYPRVEEGETYNDAFLRLSNFINNLTESSRKQITFTVRKNPDFRQVQEEQLKDLDSFQKGEYIENPLLKKTGEPVTIEVTLGDTILGYLSQPTTLTPIDNNGKQVNILSLNENELFKYYTKYDSLSKADSADLIRKNYATSLFVSDTFTKILGDSAEVETTVEQLEEMGINLINTPGQYAYSKNGVTFDELEHNTIDGNYYILDYKSNWSSGQQNKVLANIITDMDKSSAEYESLQDQVDEFLATQSAGTNPNSLKNKGRYKAIVKLPNETVSIIELTPAKMSLTQANELAGSIIDRIQETRENNRTEVEDQDVPTINDVTYNNDFNAGISDNLYLASKIGSTLTIQVAPSGDFQIQYLDRTRKSGKDIFKRTINVGGQQENILEQLKDASNIDKLVALINSSIAVYNGPQQNNKTRILDADGKELKVTLDDFRVTIPKSIVSSDVLEQLGQAQTKVESRIRKNASLQVSTNSNNLIPYLEIPNVSVVETPKIAEPKVEKKKDDGDLGELQELIDTDLSDISDDDFESYLENDFTNVPTDVIEKIAFEVSQGNDITTRMAEVVENRQEDFVAILNNIQGEQDKKTPIKPQKSAEQSRVQKLNDLRLELNKQFDSVAKAEKARLIEEGKSLAEANKESVKIAKLSVQPIEEEIKKLQSSSGALKTIPYKVLDDYGYQDIEDLQEFIKWTKENLPDFISVDDINQLQLKLYNNSVTVGQFTLSLKDISSGIEGIEGVIFTGENLPFKYHEAFHGVFRTLLSDQEINKFLNIARKEVRAKLRSEGKTLAQALKELRASSAVYNNMSKEELTERLYEEYLADKFQEFKVNNPSTVDTSSEVKSLFTRIIEIIKNIFKRFTQSDLESLFRNINSGKYRRSTVVGNRFTNATLNGATIDAPATILLDTKTVEKKTKEGDVVEVTIPQFMPLEDQNRAIGAIINIYRTKLKTADKTANPNIVLEDAVFEYAEMLNPERSFYLNEEQVNQIKNEASQEIIETAAPIDYLTIQPTLELYYRGLRLHSDQVVEAVKERLELIDSFEDSLEEIIENMDHNDESGGEHQYEKEASQRDHKRAVAREIREYIATISVEEKDQFGNIYTRTTTDENFIEKDPRIALRVLVDFESVYNGILKSVANQTDPIAILQRMYYNSQNNPQTKAFVDKFFFDIGIQSQESIEQLLEGELPTITNPDWFNKVTKTFNLFRVDNLNLVKDPSTGVVISYASNRKDDANSQIEYWRAANRSKVNFLLSKQGQNQVRNTFEALEQKMNEIDKKITINQVEDLSNKYSTKIRELTGIYLHPNYIKYSILSLRDIKKLGKNQLERRILSGFVSSYETVVEPITVDALNEIKESILRGENLFYNQQRIETDKEDDTTTTQIIENVGVKGRLRNLGLNNANFDESVGASVMRDAENNLIWAHQLPSYNLRFIQQMNNQEFVAKLKEDPYIANNPLLEDPQFLALINAGALNPLRILGVENKKLAMGKSGDLAANLLSDPNSKKSIRFGKSNVIDYSSTNLDVYVADSYNSNNGKIYPKNIYRDSDGKDFVVAPVNLGVIAETNTADFVRLAVRKAVEEDPNLGIKLTDEVLNLFEYIVKNEYNRILREKDGYTANSGSIFQGYNDETSINNGTARALKMFESEELLTVRPPSINQRRKGTKSPYLGTKEESSILKGNQRFILRGGRAYNAINLRSGEVSEAFVSDKQYQLKNHGLVNINDINSSILVEGLGDAISTTPYFDNQKSVLIGDQEYYLRNNKQTPFLRGNINLYVYEYTAPKQQASNLVLEDVELKTITEVDNTAKVRLEELALEGLNYDDAIVRLQEEGIVIKDVISDAILSSVDEYLVYLGEIGALGRLSEQITNELGVSQDLGKGKYDYRPNYDSKIAAEQLNLKENNPDFNIAQIFVNNKINLSLFNQLRKGDNAIGTKDATDNVKREKQYSGSGPNISTLLPDVKNGIEHAITTVSQLTFTDPTFDQQFDISGEIGEDQGKKADAQMYTTAKGMRYMMYGIGKYNSSMNDLMNKIDIGEKVTADEFFGRNGFKENGAVINSKKFVYGDKYVYDKMSVFALTPEYTSLKDEQGNYTIPKLTREPLHNLRLKLERQEELTNTIAVAVPESGSKRAKRNVVDVTIATDPFTELNDNDFTALDASEFKEQVVNPSNKMEGVDARQIKLILGSEQNLNQEVTIKGINNNEPITVGELKNLYHQKISGRVRLKYLGKRNLTFSLSEAIDEVHKSVDRGKVTVKLESFLDMAVSGLKASQASPQMLAFFENNGQGNSRFNLNSQVTQQQFEELFLTFFSKKVLGERQPTVTAALVSDFGVKVLRRVTKVDENGSILESEIIRDAEYSENSQSIEANVKFTDPTNLSDIKRASIGDIVVDRLRHNVPELDTNGNPTGVYYTEFMMAPHHKEVMKYIKPGDTIPDFILDAFGLRIPSQDKHSAISLKLVDFLPVVYGSSMITAQELIEVSGADFDIDKLFMAIKEFYYADGKFSEYGKGTTPRQKYEDYIRYVVTTELRRKDSDINAAVKQWSNLGDTEEAFILYSAEGQAAIEKITSLIENNSERGLAKASSELNALLVAEAIEGIDEITAKQLDIIFKANKDLNGALELLGLPVTFNQYKEYVEKFGEPYLGALNNDLVDIRKGLVANEHVINTPGRTVGIANEPADIKLLNQFFKELKEEFPELMEEVEELGIDPNDLYGQARAWNNIKTGADGIGAIVRPNTGFSVLAENNVKLFANSNLIPTWNGQSLNDFGIYTERGKSAQEGIRKQYIISAFITAMTDNAKERLAAKLSITKKALPVVGTMIALGMNYKDALYHLKHPVIKEAVYAASLEGSIKSYINARIAALKDEFITEQGLTAKINSLNTEYIKEEINTKSFSVDLNQQDPFNSTQGVEGDNAAIQAEAEIAFLENFIKFINISDNVRDLNALTDLTKGIGDIDLIDQSFEKLGLELNNKDFDKHVADLITQASEQNIIPLTFDVRKVVKDKNQFLSTYYDIYNEFTKELLPVVFLSATKPFKRIYDTTLANFKNNFRVLDESRRNRIKKDITAFFGAKAYIKYLDRKGRADLTASLQNDFIYDDKTSDILRLENVVNNLQEQLEVQGIENKWLNSFVQYSDVYDLQNNDGISKLESNSWGRPPQSEIIDLEIDFANLYSIDPVNTTHLVHYLLLKDGLTYKSGTFMNTIPAVLLEDIINQIDNVHNAFKINEDSARFDSTFKTVFGATYDELFDEFLRGYTRHAANEFLIREIGQSNFTTKSRGMITVSEESPFEVTTEKKFTIDLTRENEDLIYVFGDNLLKTGTAGQAVIRGEENAFGIPTKKEPSVDAGAYMNDAELKQNKKAIDTAIQEILAQGKSVVFPQEGLGTGLAQLKQRAPKTYSYLKKELLNKFGFDNDTGNITNTQIAKNAQRILKNSPVVFNKDTGVASINMYKGVPIYFAKDGEITIRKRRVNKRGKISDRDIKKIRSNITKIKFNGFDLSPYVDKSGNTRYEFGFPASFLTTVVLDGKRQVVLFELDKVYRDREYAKDTNLDVMIARDETIALGVRADYRIGKILGSKYQTGIGEVYGQLKSKQEIVDYITAKNDKLERQIKNVEEALDVLENTDFDKILPRNKNVVDAVADGKTVNATNKEITIDGKKLNALLENSEKARVKSEESIDDSPNVNDVAIDIDDSKMDMLGSKLNQLLNGNKEEISTDFSIIENAFYDLRDNNDNFDQIKKDYKFSTPEGLVQSYESALELLPALSQEEFIEQIKKCY